MRKVAEVLFKGIIYYCAYKYISYKARQLIRAMKTHEEANRDKEMLSSSESKALLEGIGVAKAIDEMILFNRHLDPKFNVAVAKYIAKNKEKVCCADKMKKLRATHPYLVEMIEKAEKDESPQVFSKVSIYRGYGMYGFESTPICSYECDMNGGMKQI